MNWTVEDADPMQGAHIRGSPPICRRRMSRKHKDKRRFDRITLTYYIKTPHTPICLPILSQIYP